MYRRIAIACALALAAAAPAAVPAGTDSTPASFASILAFTEHTFGLPALEANDLGAYDLSGLFSLTARNHVARPRMVTRQVPKGDHIVWSQEDEGT